MKIYGPYKDSSGNRLIIIKISSKGQRKTMSYARYLIELHLNRVLTSEETVDHIDGNPLNNEISNLQIMSLADNIRKSRKLKEFVEFTCPICQKVACKPAAQIKHNGKRNKSGPFCGRICARKHQLAYKRA